MMVFMKDIKTVALDVDCVLADCIFNIETKLNGELLWVDLLMV
jgi:hypothetical protein